MSANTATLGELLVDLRGELQQSLNPAQAVQVAPAHRVRLQRVQRMLWADFAWPHLRDRWDVSLAAGQRYYDIPEALALGRIETVHVKWGDDWYPVERGIGADEWNAFDPDDERTDPVLNWDTRPNNQIEVWPVPVADGAQVLRFTGIRALAPFVEDSDTSTLDRDLLILNAAAELAREQKDAERFAARARQHYAQLRMREQTAGDRCLNFNPPATPGRWPTPPRVSRR